jgi:hypothetical protein
LTGRHANLVQGIGVYKLRDWVRELPPGDSIALRCESASLTSNFKCGRSGFNVRKLLHGRLMKNSNLFSITSQS